LKKIENSVPTASGDYLQYTGAIDGYVLTLTADDDDQLQLYLTASDSEKYDGTLYSHEYLVKSGSTYITASTPYWLAEGVLPVYITSTYSEFKLINAYPITSSGIIGSYGSGTYGSSVYGLNVPKRFTGSLVEFQDYLPRGIENQRYSGAKLTAPAFNINSRQTIDGGPVVEWRESNPNQLIYQNNGQQGSFVLV
jgi:hypothetical protein